MIAVNKSSLAKLTCFILMSSSAVADDVVFSSNQSYSSGSDSIMYQAQGHSAVRTVTVNSGITLSSLLSPTAGLSVIYIDANMASIANNGLVTSDYYTITINSATVTSFVNNGSITEVTNGNPAISVDADSIITTLTNLGTISTTGSYAVYVDDGHGPSTIGTLNNAQGAGNSAGALTYSGALPTNYNIIINSATHYGQLAGTSVSGSTTFGIYSGSLMAKGTYSAVLTGLTTSNISATRTGIYDGYTWTLALQSGSSTIWDLIVTGVSASYTQSSLNALATKLRGAFSGQVVATNYANMNTYDCDLFDNRGLCVSVGGQQTYVDNPSANQTSTVLTVGYKVSPQIRIGGFLNQSINNHTSSSVDISNRSPLMGLFAVWNQNEDRLGYQVKIANAYQDKDVTTTREVINTSEAGTGKTDLNTQSYVGELSYAFLANEGKTLVRPYAALRYTRIKQDGYTEQASATVTTPLTYAALEDRSTAALVGVKLDHKLADNFHLKGSVGVEQDLYHHVDNLTATGVSGLTSESFNDNIKRTRPVASIGAYFIPAKNQRIAGDIYYQQLPFQSTGSTTAYVNYTIGF